MTIHYLTFEHRKFLAFMGLQENLSHSVSAEFSSTLEGGNQNEECYEYVVTISSFRHMVLSAMRSRIFFRDKYNIDLGFSASAWREILLKKSENFKMGLAPASLETMPRWHKMIEGRLGNQTNMRTERYSALLWNCLEKKSLLHIFCEKRFPPQKNLRKVEPEFLQRWLKEKGR